MSRNMTTWRKELTEAFAEAGEDISKMVCTLDDAGLDKEFYPGFGGSEGPAFTAWGEKYVYFPVVYDGSEWVGKAPRNPCDEATEHVGGE
jgi:hypothetical protein